MKTFTYLIKSVKEISLDQLRKELVTMEENFSDEEITSIIKIRPDLNGALLTTSNKELIDALLKNTDYKMTLQS